MDPKTTTDENILAISWNIATESKLYRKLASNPYSRITLQIISERFPNVSTADIIKAIILAEPIGRYDRNFSLLGAQQQEEELNKQRKSSAEINKRVAQYYNEYAKELSQLPKEFVYNGLFVVVFRTADLSEVEEKYSQNQRRDFKLSIVNFIENNHSLSSIAPYDKKPAFTRSLLKVSFAALFFLLLFFLPLAIYAIGVEQVQTQNITQNQAAKKKILGIETQKENQSFPVRLQIPRINVDAAIEYMGLTPEGAMNVPESIIDVGWYKLGPIPGEPGSAVISGHFDGREGESGVFNNLDELKQGDSLYVINNLGTTTKFVVRESRLYNPGYADEVFLPKDNGTHLNLITCDGVWDGAKKSYSKRLVVFADITP